MDQIDIATLGSDNILKASLTASLAMAPEAEHSMVEEFQVPVVSS